MPVSPLIANPYACARTNAVPNARTATKPSGRMSAMRNMVVTCSCFAACARAHRAGAAWRRRPQPAAPAHVRIRCRSIFPTVRRSRRSCEEVVDAADGRGQEVNWILAIAVVDPNGDLVYFGKMDHTQIASVDDRAAQGPRGGHLPPSDQGLLQNHADTAGAFVYHARRSTAWSASQGGVPLVGAARSSARSAAAAAPAPRTRQACKAGVRHGQVGIVAEQTGHGPRRWRRGSVSFQSRA